MAININNPLNPKANPQQKKGSGFVNLNRVLEANANNRLGQAIGTGIKSGAEQVKGQLGELKTGFENETQKQNLASDANKQAASQALMNIGAGNTNVSDDTAKQFGTFLAGNYAGPTALDASKTAQVGARANEIQGFGQNLGSQGDKSQVLQAFVGKGPYSAGQKRLDASLLGKGPNVQALKEAQAQSRGLTQAVGREQDIARNTGELRQGQAKQFATDVGNQIKGQQTGIEGAVQSEVDRLSGIQGGLYDTIKGKLASGEALTPQERAMLGLNDQAPGAIGNKMVGLPGQQAPLMDIYNLDPTKFLNKAELSKGNVASAQQKAQLEALSKLGQKNIKDFTDVDTKAGQYDTNKPLQFDRDTLKKQADIVKQQYDAEMRRGLGLSLGEQLTDAPSSAWGVLGDAAGVATAGLGHAIDAFVTGNPSQFNLYEYADTLGGMPNIANMNYQQAVDAVNAYERKIQPFVNRVLHGHPDDGGRQSKTKENNLRGAYDTVVPRLQAVKQQLAEYKANMDKQYGIGRKI